jgi:hypothetical protein
MVLKFLMNTLVMNIGSKFHLYFDEVFEDMKKIFLEKYIPKNNKLFLGIICTQRTPIIELFLERP